MPSGAAGTDTTAPRVRRPAAPRPLRPEQVLDDRQVRRLVSLVRTGRDMHVQLFRRREVLDLVQERQQVVLDMIAIVEVLPDRHARHILQPAEHLAENETLLVLAIGVDQRADGKARAERIRQLRRAVQLQPVGLRVHRQGPCAPDMRRQRDRGKAPCARAEEQDLGGGGAA
ncbi:hypothetical protein SDC9_21406 [bioreactor metagenome]|uniref:Uncharacterized protein n=1 Tax=bioreactor metagenome TaxID=1076179 RepID=A0A644U9G8_9ZZZZ